MSINRRFHAGPSLGLVVLMVLISAVSARAQIQKNNKIEAVVNDKVVTSFDVFEKLKEEGINYRKLSASAQKGEFDGGVQNLVLAILRAEAAKKAGVRLSEEQLRGSLSRYIEARFGGEDGFESFLNSSSQSEKTFVDDFREKRETQAWLRVVSGRGAAAKQSEDLRPLYDITVTPKEMRTYYRLNQAKLFVTKDEVEVRFIKIFYKRGQKKALRRVKQRMRAIMASLATKADFAVLAEKHSDDVATKENGGYIGWVEKTNSDKLPTVIEKMLFEEGVKAGDVLGPKNHVNAYWLLKVENVRRSRTVPFVDAQDKIRTVLVGRKNQAALRRVLRDLVERAYIFPPQLKRQIQANLASRR